MQVWFANTMWVDEALSVQKGTSVVMGAGSLKPLHHVIYYVHQGTHIVMRFWICARIIYSSGLVYCLLYCCMVCELVAKPSIGRLNLNQCYAVIWMYKEHMFRFFNYFRIRDMPVLFLWKKSTSMNQCSQIFQKPLRTDSFQERPSKALAVLWSTYFFKKSWELWLYIRFKSLIVWEPWLWILRTVCSTTAGVLSMFVITVQQWFDRTCMGWLFDFFQ